MVSLLDVFGSKQGFTHVCAYACAQTQAHDTDAYTLKVAFV